MSKLTFDIKLLWLSIITFSSFENSKLAQKGRNYYSLESAF